MTNQRNLNKTLVAFQKLDLSPSKWEDLADQVLSRVVHKVKVKLRKKHQPARKRRRQFQLKPQKIPALKIVGIGELKTKEPIRFGNPIKHSVKEVPAEVLAGIDSLKLR